jgi:hypothetical protein
MTCSLQARLRPNTPDAKKVKEPIVVIDKSLWNQQNVNWEGGGSGQFTELISVLGHKIKRRMK